MIDAIVVIILILITSLAVKSILKNKNQCSGNCADCSGACHIDFDEIKKAINKQLKNGHHDNSSSSLNCLATLGKSVMTSIVLYVNESPVWGFLFSLYSYRSNLELAPLVYPYRLNHQ